PLERLGELDANLLLLGGREGVDDPVDGLGSALRVERGEHQVTGLGGGQGQADGLEVPHLADQDHVRVLAQRGPQRRGERLGVGADLALVHQAVLGLVHELDRVLQRDDVLLPRRVDQVDHRGQRGGLAGAGGAGDQDQPVLPQRQRLHDLREVELLEGADLGRDDAEDGPFPVSLVEDVDPEAGALAQLASEAEIASLLEQAALVVVEEVVDHLVDRVPGQHLVGDRRQLAVQAHHRLRPRREVEVGGGSLLGLDQEIRDVHGAVPCRLRSSPRSSSVTARTVTRWREPSRRTLASAAVAPTSAPRGTSSPSRWTRPLWLVPQARPARTSAPCSALAMAARHRALAASSSTTTTSAGWPSLTAAVSANSPGTSTWTKPGTTWETPRSSVTTFLVGAAAAWASA